ncbi:hypothetical protein K7X08_033878 [Anisodus acutangulus]|uniref:Uncharacterized protein n=1 Tax=Anisodus acutangulus TaxID=402998 RepID=A0A9Q1RCK2_9SOLA|nr:hypothetical protein K7X08_033878 [Anisodus acutangulus]
MSFPTEEASTQNEDTEKKEDIYEDWIPNATKMVEMLYNFCFHHYTSNPEEKISDIEHQIGLLDSIPQEKRQSESERSMFAYLKGRLYNAIPDVYKEEAEHYLVEADQNSIILRQLAELELQFAPGE